jgi:hypothetical protein
VSSIEAEEEEEEKEEEEEEEEEDSSPVEESHRICAAREGMRRHTAEEEESGLNWADSASLGLGALSDHRASKAARRIRTDMTHQNQFLSDLPSEEDEREEGGTKAR